MKLSHLVPALVALALTGCLVGGFDFHARTVEDQYAHALAGDTFHQKSLGDAVQKATLRQPDLLPVYGSSEVTYGGAASGGSLFSTYPAGFNISRIGFMWEPILCMAMQFAGDGSLLRGKKVVLVLDRDTVTGDGKWAVDFSALEANELVFSSDLSLGLKQRIAGEMVKQNGVMSKDTLLEFAVQRLAAASPADRALYFAVFPLGKLHVFIMRLQDHWEILTYIWNAKKLLPAVQRQPAAPNWASLATIAAAQVATESANNMFNVSNNWWRWNGAFYLQVRSTKSKSSSFVKTVSDVPWQDLELTLAELQELGATTLVVGIPMHGPYMDFTGVSRQARAVYYDKLVRLGQRYGAKVITFQDHEYDKYFFPDLDGHASAEGWVYIDQVLDEFYHGTLR
jgi:D-alanine transfer protein